MLFGSLQDCLFVLWFIRKTQSLRQWYHFITGSGWANTKPWQVELGGVLATPTLLLLLQHWKETHMQCHEGTQLLVLFQFTIRYKFLLFSSLVHGLFRNFGLSLFNFLDRHFLDIFLEIPNLFPFIVREHTLCCLNPLKLFCWSQMQVSFSQHFKKIHLKRLCSSFVGWDILSVSVR